MKKSRPEKSLEIEMKSGKMTKSPKFFFVFKATTSALEVKLLVLVNLALMFAAHKEKSFVSAFFKVIVLEMS